MVSDSQEVYIIPELRIVTLEGLFETIVMSSMLANAALPSVVQPITTGSLGSIAVRCPESVSSFDVT